MSDPAPRPHPLRAVLLLLGLAVRRWFNRLSQGMAARKAARADGASPARPPTARRRAGMGAILIVAGVAITGQVCFASAMFLARSAGGADPAQAPMEVSAATDEAAGSPASGPGVHTPRPFDRAAIERTLADPGGAAHLLGDAGLLFAIIALTAVALTLGMGNADLARPEAGELWLAAQPLSNRVLHGARLVQYALLNPLVWMLVAPSAATMAYCAGRPLAAAIGLGLAAAAAWAVATAALRLLLETWLRQHLAHARIKNLQAVCTVAGMAAMVALYAAALGEGPLPAWFSATAAAAPWALLPSGWTAQAAFGGNGGAAAWLAIGVAVAGCMAAAALAVCDGWTRGGFIVHDGTMGGRRGGGAGRWRAFAVLGKDLLLLRRDRALLVQAFIVPLFMIALQLALNPGLASSAAGSVHAAATFALALGAWVLMSATAALAYEGHALWILANAPRPLAELMRGKVLMWATFAVAYGAAGLAVILVALPWPGPSAIADAAMVLASLPLLAALAVGIGAAATDPQAENLQRRVGVGATWLYMLVGSLLTLALAKGSSDQRIAALVVLAVVAWALWQRLRDRLAYLFEPIDRPPRRIDLADGAWTALAFLVLQVLSAALLAAAGAPLEVIIPTAFGVAGALSASLALLWLWRARVPGLLAACGVLPRERARPLRDLVLGLAVGLACAAAAAGYLALLPHLASVLPGLAERIAAAEADARVGGGLGWGMAVAAIALAPLCEEFIFRGLLFRGFRNDLGLWGAALASAAVFAVMHPALGWPPILLAGTAFALLYARTGWLLAPVVAHATYNSVMVAAAG